MVKRTVFITPPGTRYAFGPCSQSRAPPRAGVKAARSAKGQRSIAGGHGMAGKAGRIGIGLVGSGFMGRAHALAFAAAAQVFGLPLRPELTVLADRDEATAGGAARK